MSFLFLLCEWFHLIFYKHLNDWGDGYGNRSERYLACVAYLDGVKPSLIDVLVDGEFVQELYSVALAFRGSENQRIIDVKKSLETGEIVWHALMSRGISMKFN